MKAYECDICGRLFYDPVEIDVRGISKICWATMHRTTDGSRIDVCNNCRLAILYTIEDCANAAREREGAI